MEKLIDIDVLWRVAARRTKAAQTPPRNLDLDGLRSLTAALEVPGRYDTQALRLIQREIFLWISSYQAFEQDLTRYPELLNVPVERPVFVVGFGRTGSTLLHNLLALDPEARAPLLWELLTPSPPQRVRNGEVEPRIAQAQRRLDGFILTDPRISHIHPMAAEAPDECHWMMRHTPLTVTLYHVPEYWAWLKQLDRAELRQLYAVYRRQMQHLQLFGRRGRWLSKAFSHQHYLPVLFDVFPDAKVVRLHRHPCQAIPSLCSLVSIYRRMISREVDLAAIGSLLLDMFDDGAGRSTSALSNTHNGQAVDISYDALTASPIDAPIAEVRRLYASFNLTVSGEFAQIMTRYLEAQQANVRQRHVYSLADFGLSREQVIERTADYLKWAEGRCGTLIR